MFEFEDFSTTDGSTFSLSVVKKTQIPPQIRLDDVSSLDTKKEVIGDSLQTVSGTDLILKLLLAGSLGKIWSLFNELSIVENMNLFALKIPGSWSYFAEELENLTSLGIEDYIEGILYVPE